MSQSGTAAGKSLPCPRRSRARTGPYHGGKVVMAHLTLRTVDIGRARLKSTIWVVRGQLVTRLSARTVEVGDLSVGGNSLLDRLDALLSDAESPTASDAVLVFGGSLLR